MNDSAGTRFRQPAVVDSRSVAAEWGDGLLDADGDTKQVSRLEVDGANPSLLTNGSSEEER
jgi:hypothetical protein